MPQGAWPASGLPAHLRPCRWPLLTLVPPAAYRAGFQRIRSGIRERPMPALHSGATRIGWQPGSAILRRRRPGTTAAFRVLQAPVVRCRWMRKHPGTYGIGSASRHRRSARRREHAVAESREVFGYRGSVQ